MRISDWSSDVCSSDLRTGGGGIVAETATCPEPIMADQYLPATPTVQVDDERVRVTEWRIPKGGATSWHRHEMPYVVIPIEGGRLRVATADGDVQAEMVAGTDYSRPPGGGHDGIKHDDHDTAFIVVECTKERRER